MVRGDKRIIGGVCYSISKKNKIQPWILRLIFIITSFLFVFPVLIYIILWLIIPNQIQVKPVVRKQKHLLQTIGIITGGVIGWYVGHELGLLAIDGDKTGGLVLAIFSFIGVPVGSIIGFSIARIKAEKEVEEEQRRVEKEREDKQ